MSGAELRVRILAYTQVNQIDGWWDDLLPVKGIQTEDIDYVAEFAGRACYQSFDRPNPATAENKDYLANILDQQHYSVLEHGHVVLYVEHVSRSLLAELTRHRHISLSVESQRYVDIAKVHPDPVVPPALRDTELAEDMRWEYGKALAVYRHLFDRLVAAGSSRKQAREAARSVMPNSTPVNLVVSGNIRAWRDVLGKRHHVAADAEIQEFALAVIERLREVAPHGIQDIPTLPFGSDEK